VAAGGRALPWDDRLLFAEIMLRSDLRSYRRAEKWAGRVFFDRGVVDVVGYLRLLGLSIPRHIQDAPGTFRYNRTAFIAPPWKEIYEQDRERKQDFAEAVRTYKTMVTAYADYGYELVEMPCDSIERRMRFVLDESSRSIGT
jgi:predicted ATPase